MKVQRLAVIGSNSFAGAAFIRVALDRGGELVGFNRSPEGSEIFLPWKRSPNRNHYRFHQADINRDLSAMMQILDAFKPEAVVDFSGQGMVAESWSDPAQWYTTNIVAKVRLHEELRKRNWLKRFMRISTPEVYGSQDEPSRESWQFNPSTPYAVSHAAADLSLRAFFQQYRFPVLFGRFANFYGPGQQLYRIIPRTIIYGLTGRKLPLHGGGHSIRAFIHESDVSEGILRCLELGEPGEVYHFSPKVFYSIRQVVELVCRKMGIDFADLVEISEDRPGKDKAYLMDSQKAREKLSWEDRTSLEQGVGETVQWVKDHLNEIRQLPLDYVYKA